MIRRILVLALVGFGLGGLALGTWFAGTEFDWLPEGLVIYLWPALLALAWLALAGLAFLWRLRPLFWAAAAGFVVQAVATLLFVVRLLEFSWQPALYSLVAVLVVIVAILVIWAVTSLRARWLERRMIEGVGAAGTEQELQAVREGMSEALRLLGRAGKGRQAIYLLPWFLVIGRSQAGKTVAIKNSGLGLPVRKDWVKGVGGTHTCDWFFTNDMIFLDTPGKWVAEGTDRQDQRYWQELLRLLARHRGRRPLDGLVVVVPADDLLSLPAERLRDQAGKVREVVDLLHEELQFRIPVYLLVSKCDLVGGFTDFFRGLPAQRRHEILGWSHPDPNRGEPAQLIVRGLRRVVRRLEAYRLEMLARVGSRRRARRLYFFPEEFKRLETGLAAFADVFFHQDRFSESPVFRGFYFTSGTQEGSPLSQAMTDLARQLGVPRTAGVTAATESEPKRSFFLLELFRTLLVRDEGLVGRTAGHWFRRRRNTAVAVFTPAALGLLLALVGAWGFVANRALAREAAEDVPRVVRELERLPADGSGAAVLPALEHTGRLRDLHAEMTGFTLFRGLGMRRGLREEGGLAEQTFRLFDGSFAGVVLGPTLRAAERVATDPGRSCTDRIDVLHSVVWLRMGRRAQWSDDLAGFGNVWDLPPEERATARRALLRQFGYLVEHAEPDASLLPGFGIHRVARSIGADCRSQGATSALAQYLDFQQDCADVGAPAAIEDCYARLRSVIDFQQEDFERFIDHFENLKEDLAELAGIEPEAEAGLRELREIDPRAQDEVGCLGKFDDVIENIESYVVADDVVEQCRAAVADEPAGQKFAARQDFLASAQEEAADTEQAVRRELRDYADQCRNALRGFERLEFPVLERIVEGYQAIACYHPAMAEPAEPVRPAPVRRAARSLRWFATPAEVPNTYEPATWQARRSEWLARLGNTEVGFDEAMRAHEREAVASEVRSYGARYREAWERYLSSLRLQRGGVSVPEWLERLSATDEWVALIGPAADAARIAEGVEEPALQPIREELGGLDGLQSFLERDLGRYVEYLDRIARDLQRARREPEFYADSRAAVAAGDPEHPLVAARSWVRRVAGPQLAGGALRELLERPLEQARSFLASDNLLAQQWRDLRTLYQDSLAGRFPFSGNPGDPPADEQAVRALLGRASGLVPNLAPALEGSDASSAARGWMERALRLSRALFEEGSDAFRPVPVYVSYRGASIEPEKLDKKLMIAEIDLYLGSPAEQLHWEDESTAEGALRLYGEQPATTSWLQAAEAGRKGFFRRALPGEDYAEGEDRYFARTAGPWAPVALIAQGVDAPATASPLALSYRKQAEVRGTEGTVTLRFEAEGRDLPELLRLYLEGLPAPPGDVTGS
jgi:hypothetical protein